MSKLLCTQASEIEKFHSETKVAFQELKMNLKTSILQSVANCHSVTDPSLVKKYHRDLKIFELQKQTELNKLEEYHRQQYQYLLVSAIEYFELKYPGVDFNADF